MSTPSSFSRPQPRLEDRAGGTYVVATMDVPEVKQPYYGLRMWFIWGVG